ncbi:MAG: sialate O-acetylesterase [Pedobacter sp.]|nr:MAG: sialate O-acetylesterase [Pedobacter sp.]
MKTLVPFLLVLLLSANSLRAELKLPALIANGMVLQRDQPIKIWGWASAKEIISVTFKDKTYSTKTGENGEWSVILAPQKAGGPFKMRINQIELHDLLIGDVWLCSGQSNMEAQMSRANIKANYPKEIQESNYPQIRQFTVKRNMAFLPITDVQTDNGWISANPNTILDFSAVAYFFAKELYERYKVPIGIINSSVGGTPIQSWVSSDYTAVPPMLQDTSEVKRILKAHELKTEQWHKSIREEDLGMNQKWFLGDNNEQGDWQSVNDLSKLNQAIKLPKYGSMWFKTTITIPPHLVGKPATLSLGMMHTEDETYLNGQKIGGINSGYTERHYPVPAHSLKEGENSLMIRLISPTTGISFNTTNTYTLRFDKDSIPLTKPWNFNFGIEKELLPRGNGLSLHSPTAYYYAMIKPLSKYGIKGVAWYQGESNIPKPQEYETLLTSLIKLWRTDWQQTELPFLIVQLANYSSTGIEPEVSNWALLRAAQLEASKTPYTAMIVTHDIGERDDLHPKNKLDVGKRLSLAARKVAYGENIVFSGPIYKSMKIDGSEAIVSFDHIGKGLMKIGDRLQGFSLSADGKNFTAANARIVGRQVIVSSANISKPVALRYAWADSPDGANLYNKEGLPAASFKSN